MSDWPVGLSTVVFTRIVSLIVWKRSVGEVSTSLRFVPSPRTLTTMTSIRWLVPLAGLRSSVWKLIRFMRHFLIPLI